MAEDPSPDATPVGQLALVALCGAGLVVAGVALPASTPAAGPLDLGFLFDGRPTDCTVRLLEEPVPGQSATVVVEQRGRPVAGAPVWFNGDRVGRTDEHGRATGEVPYVRELRVQVRLPSGGRCAFVRGEDPDARQPTPDGAPATLALGHDAPASSGGSATGGTAMAGVRGASFALAPTSGPTQQADAGNQSGEYTIHSAIDVAVEGDTYPGEAVTVVATIDGRPVPNASVAVDGEGVGRTDARGRLAIQTPGDSGTRMLVTVSRGELVTERRVPVLVLGVHFRTSDLPLPGEPAAAVTTLGGERVSGGTVSLDGRRLGESGPGGEVRFALPADPTATVTVRRGEQTATRSVAWAYLPTVLWTLAALLVLVVAPVVAHRTAGRRGLAVVGTVGLLAASGVVGGAVGGRAGALAGTGLAALALAAAVARRRGVSARPPPPGDLRAGLSTRALAATRRVETLLDRARRRLSALWIRLRAFTLRGQLAALRAWLRSLPARLGRALGGLSRRRETDDEPEQPTDEPGATGTQRGLRALWRRFARRVEPESWRQRTPGEVSREAVAQGLPADAVRELTDLFRDVEYGGRDASAEVDRRAARAAAEIEREEGER